jgi:hypothetical protein
MASLHDLVIIPWHEGCSDGEYFEVPASHALLMRNIGLPTDQEKETNFPSELSKSFM